jgi:hypothetical protein
MNLYSVDSDEAMKQCDEALNASSIPFSRSASSLHRNIFLFRVKRFITVTFYQISSFNATSPLHFQRVSSLNASSPLIFKVTLPLLAESGIIRLNSLKGRCAEICN